MASMLISGKTGNEMRRSAGQVVLETRQAILMLVTHWFEHRSAITIGEAPVVTPQGVHALIAPYRRMSLC